MPRAANCPDRCSIALLIIDMINDLEFAGSEALRRQVGPLARRIAALADRARADGIPVLYVNDNFGRWRSDFKAIVEHVSHSDHGRKVTELLHPHPQDYFVLKPKHSGFFATSLEVLLHELEARRLVITGMAGDLCILFTANDAHMRGYRVVVPRDCVASNTEERNEQALTLMHRSLSADIGASTSLDLRALREPLRERSTGVE
jgi:nicotinamidase-related amidase